MSDFVQSSWNDFLNEKFSWELVMTQFFSVRNMDDKELQKAILSDLLGVTFWEKEKNTKVSFTEDDLIRFIYGQQRHRITEMLNHENISNLISVENDQIRIRDQHEILQAAMEFAGVWFGKYEPKDPTGVLKINRDVVSEEDKKVGGLDNFIQSISMDLISNTAENISKH